MELKGSPENLLTDEELVAAIVRNRNAELFGHIYDRYAQRVYNKCRGFARSEAEAEDLTQDVFLHLFLKLPTFKGASRFSTWVYSLTYNFCVNYVNRDKQRKMSDKAVRDTEIEEEELLEEIDEQEFMQMQAEKLAVALQQIDAADRALLLLKYQDGLSIKELQDSMELGESAIKMRLKRARAKVMDEYRKIT